MKLAEVLEQIGEGDPQGEVALRWDESMASLPDTLPFLQPDFISMGIEWGGLEFKDQAPLEETAKGIAEDPVLKALAWHAYRRLYDYDDRVDFTKWPALEEAMNYAGGCFYLLIGMAMIPRTRAVHEALGVPEEVTRETCLQVGCFADNFGRAHHGRLGLFREQLFWMRNYTDGKLFRLGRFEYMLKPMEPLVHVFRHRERGLTLALSGDGRWYNAAGYAVQEGDPDAWEASLSISDEEARGFPIHPAGHALCHEVTLSRSEWEYFVKPGDYMLDTHIPSGGGMTPERCLDSMRRGVEFFRRQFPDKPFKSFWCHSWIFGPQLEKIFPERANLVKFLREVYVYPIYSEDGGLWFIFMQEKFDLATAPRENSLQIAVADYLENGGEWYEGGMIVLVDDLDHFGEQIYRKRWPEVTKLLGLPA
ncbi:MAG: acyltransferase domain-containing protein [Candidatus Hydrogenedentota bacterium]